MNCKGDGGMKENAFHNQHLLRPGDLVEIRVWCIRPGMVTQASGASKSVSSVLKSNVKPGTATSIRPTSLHSRNISLATMTSVFTNMSVLTASPQTGGESPGSVSTTEVNNKLVCFKHPRPGKSKPPLRYSHRQTSLLFFRAQPQV